MSLLRCAFPLLLYHTTMNRIKLGQRSKAEVPLGVTKRISHHGFIWLLRFLRKNFNQLPSFKNQMVDIKLRIASISLAFQPETGDTCQQGPHRLSQSLPACNTHPHYHPEFLPCLKVQSLNRVAFFQGNICQLRSQLGSCQSAQAQPPALRRGLTSNTYPQTSSARVITKYRRLGGSNTDIYFSWMLRLRSPRSRCQPSYWLKTAAFSLCLCMAETSTCCIFFL